MSGPPRMSFEEYDERYPIVFDRLVEQIHAVCPGTRVEHVGSTAISGLAGRGTVDAVLVATESSRASIVETLEQTGFARAPFEWVDATLIRTIELDGQEYGTLLYVLAEGHELVEGWIAMRGYLRNHPEEAQRYMEVKRAALAAGHVQPWAYQQAKAPYLENLTQQLHLDESHPRSGSL